MAKIIFQKREIEKHFKLSEEIIEKINMFGTPASLQGDELEVEIFPNRPDLLSMQGFIRALKAFLGKETGLKKYKLNKPEKDYVIKISPTVKDIRPFTACAIVRNLKFDNEKIKEIIDLQEKLHATIGRNRKKIAIGIYPLEKITLPIKYEALVPENIKFIPLESDKEMNGRQILSSHPTGREYAHLLEGKSKFPVFADAKGKILSMPPIINSSETGKITEATREVFIECSGFDFNVLSKILNIIITTLAEMSGKIYQMKLEYEKTLVTPNFEPEKAKISLENVNKLLGLALKEKDLEKLLPKMQYDYKAGSVLIPAWRTDILHEVDIIEDIAIAYGYDNLIPEIPRVSTIGEESQESKIKSKISEILAGLGLLEVSSYHLIKAEEAKLARLEEKEKLELENSKTDYKILRPSLLIPALRILAENKDNEYPQNIFELGAVFSRDKTGKTETGIKESEHLLVALCPNNFTALKQSIDYLFKMLGVSYELKEKEHKGMIDGRVGSILVNGKEVGYLGEVHPQTLQDWSIKMPLAVMEISLEDIFSLLREK